jgi:hypothetical protein
MDIRALRLCLAVLILVAGGGCRYLTRDPAGRADSADAGPVAHWTFDEGSGDLAKDVTGHGHDGTIHGAVRTPSPWGQALRFGGDGTYVDCGKAESLNLRGDITIVARVKADQVTDGYHMIFVDAAASGKEQNYALYLHQGKLVFRNGDGFSNWAYQRTIVAERPFPVNSWQTVVVVFEGVRYWIYQNGVVVEDGETAQPITPTRGGNRIIGGFEGNVLNGFRGEIDDVRLYNRALSHHEVLALEEAPAAAPPQMLLKPRLKYTEQNLYCETLVLGDCPPGSVLELSARDRQQDRQVGHTSLPLVDETSARSGRWRATGVLSTAEWLQGEHELAVSLRDAAGNELDRATAEVVYPGPKPEYPAGKPPWLNSKEGRTDRVLPPFTPLQASRTDSGCRISPWGRTYEFGASPFLAQITSRQAPLLAGPMRLGATVDGTETSWTAAASELAQSGEEACCVRQRMSSPAADVEVTVTIEYDGLARFDWALRPRQSATVERLVVEIPFRKGVARNLYTWPRVTSGALGESYASPFQPLVWLGDEERGVQWLCESERNWSLQEVGRALEIVRQGDEVVLRLNLVTRPVRIEAGKALDYTFGLQASPVKPMAQDAWDARIVRATQWYGKELDLPDLKVGEKPVLEYYAEKGAKAIMVWYWWDAFAYPLPIGHEERFRRLVRECHRVGLKVLPYVGGFLLSERAPEAPFFGDEMRVRPMPPYRSTANVKWPGWTPQRCLFACQRGPWQDFIVDGIARLIDECDVDGVYLDTTTVPFACCNDLHGCGYREADRQTRPSYPVFSVRDNLRRIYTTVKQRKPDGLVDLHVYDCMNLPGLTWATTYWNGEQLSKQPLAVEALPLDRFRTEFMGRNWGVPADVLYYKLKDYKGSVALGLLHDVPVRPEYLADLDRISQLWQVRDEFGVKQARWLPYWSNADVVQVEPAGCYASLYVHPQGRVLACVSNLGAQAAAVRCRFDLAKLGLAQTVAARDALSNTPLSIQDGAVTLDIPAGAYRLVRVGE